MEENVYRLALLSTPGIGDIYYKQLLSYCGSAQEVFVASKHKLTKIPGVGETIASAIQSSHGQIEEAKEELAKLEKENARILTYTEPDYPKKLKEISDAPPVLFYKGSADLNNPKAIAIVGTRNCTDYGKRITEEIIEGLKNYRPLIVSGLAYGIDIHAHKHALKSGLETLGVMASGIDIIYPGIHRKIVQKMLKSGGILTEYLTGVQPDAPHFPSRNRIIAGMVDAVIVIEAAARGGALITAELANGYNREVFAVPGKTNNTYSEGCNKLIRNHKASIYTRVDDILYLLNWPNLDEDTGQGASREMDLTQFNEKERIVIELLLSNSDGLMLDELSWKSQIPVHQLASILLGLELGGILDSLPGKKYRLKGG